MSATNLEFDVAAAPVRRGWLAVRHPERALLALVLLLLVALPLTEAALRAAGHAGIPGSAALVQHLTLVATMLGAALAAREGKLLRLFELSAFAPHYVQVLCRAVSATGAALVSLVLALAAWQLVESERAVGGTLALGLPLWVVQCVIPIGFAVMAVRLLTRAEVAQWYRIAGAALVMALTSLWPLWCRHAATCLAPALVLLALTALAGAPIFAILGGLALIFCWQAGTPLGAVALEHYRMLVNPSLPAIPLFTLAVFILAAGAAPRRLTFLFRALFGHFRGGAAIWGASLDAHPAPSPRAFDGRRAWHAIRLAKWDLGLPVVVFASLFGGLATPVEAAALTATYVLIVEILVHGSLPDWQTLARVLSDCGALVGGVLLIVGVALGLSNYLVILAITYLPGLSIWIPGLVR